VFVYDRHILLKKRKNIFLCNTFQNIDTSTRNERIIYGKTWVFSSGSDEGDNSFFYKRKEGILLCFIPSMNLVEKEDGLSSFTIILLCFYEYFCEIFLLREYSGEMKKFRVECL
jgi:hypothetical protein